MAYVAAADFREATQKPWARGLVLTEAQGDDAMLDAVIADVVLELESDLGDDFDPPTPDNDEVLEVNGSGTSRLFIPRRVRSLTTVKTRKSDGTLTTETATTYRLLPSLNAGGTVMLLDERGKPRRFDWLDILPDQSVSTGRRWLYGVNTVQLTGKFGWAVVPDEIKRLVSILVYERVKPSNVGLRRAERLQTDQATYTFVTPDDSELGIPEADRIRKKYARQRKTYAA